VELESLATVAFTSAGKAVDKEITKYELDRFCFGTSPHPCICCRQRGDASAQLYGAFIDFCMAIL
jgi:hypothetical protein